MAFVNPQLLDLAFSKVSETRDSAREKIIDLGSIGALEECVAKSRREKDAENLEFWLIEKVTCRGDAKTIGQAIIELAIEVHKPQGRFNEGLVYLRYIQKSLFDELYLKVTQLIADFELALSRENKLIQNGQWENYDLTKRIEVGQTQQHYFDRFIAYFIETNDDERAELVAELQVDYLPRIIGYFQGLNSSISKFGVESETAIAAFVEFMKIAYPKFSPGLVKIRTGSFGQDPDAETAIRSREPGQEVEENTENQGPKPSKKGYGITKSK
jgi:hypothetical protein